MAEKNHNAQEAQEAREEAEELVKTIVVPLEGAIEPGAPGWAEAVEAAGGIEEILQGTIKSLAEAISKINAAVKIAMQGIAIDYETWQAELNAATSTIKEKEEEYQALINDPDGPLAGYTRILSVAKGINILAAGFYNFLDVSTGLGEYLERELEKPEYDGLTGTDMMHPLKEDDPESGTPWHKAVQAAADAMRAADPERYENLKEILKEPREDEEDETPRMKHGSIDLMATGYLPMLNGPLINDFMLIPKRADWEEEEGKFALSFEDSKIILEEYEKIKAQFSTATDKLIDTCAASLTAINYNKTDNINPTVIIDLYDYWRKQGFRVDPDPMPTKAEQEEENKKVENCLKWLKADLNNDLFALQNTIWVCKNTGKNKGLKGAIRIVSSYIPHEGRYMEINFDIRAAEYLIKNNMIMQWSTLLLKHDNRDRNGYRIGRKMLFHSSMDNNYMRGIDGTLSVRSLLKAAPDISTMEELRKAKQRNWKRLIKGKLEKALDNNIKIGILQRWEYRNPKDGTTYTPESANDLLWPEYQSLMVDFTKTAEADQAERRAKKEAEKALREEQEKQKRIAIEAAKELAKEKATKKKAGRPRKKTNQGG